jgi:mannose-6-phosphate isomerase-like protein (cupin superfamily)
MRKLLIGGVTGTVALLGVWVGVARAQGAQGGAAQSVSPAPTDKAMYVANSEIQSTWKDLEARQVINRRVMEGGAYSINIRIVKQGDPPRVHSQSCDVWVVQAGSATAITGGELLGVKKNPKNDDAVGSSINGGIEQPLQPGDILYVPPGVPHGFKNAKGFRAFLIRFNTK